MPYQSLSRKTKPRPLLSRARLERAMRAADYNAAELAKIVTALGTSVTRQSIANLRTGAVRSVRVELAEGIERALHVEAGSLFGVVGEPPPEQDTDDLAPASAP